MKSKRCQSCTVLSNRSESFRSKSKEKIKQLCSPRGKPKKLKKKYEIIAQPIRQCLRKNQRMVKQIQDKYTMYKQHVSMRQQTLLKKFGTSAEQIAELKEQMRQKDQLILRLNHALKQQQQNRINLSVSLVKTKNQLHVLKKQNDFYLQTHQQFQKDKWSVEKREKEFRQLKVAFKQLQKEVLLLNKMVQES